MIIFMIKKFLSIFLVTIISFNFLVIDNVSALSNNEFEVVYKTNTRILKKPSYYGYKYGIVFYISGTGFTYFLSNEPLGYSKNYIVVNQYDNYNFEYKENDNAFSTHELAKFKTFTNSYGINTSDRPIVWSNYDIPEVQADSNSDGSVNYYYSTGNVTFFCNADECVNSLQLKKEFSHSDKNNPIKYIDLYFDNRDFQKNINFELKIKDNNDYTNCIENCNYADITGFDISYLTKEETGIYKWESLNSFNTGVGIDYEGEQFPHNTNGTGVTLKGKINLNFDKSQYNFEKIRISIGLTNANNIQYKYFDKSSLSSLDIDEYYHYMMSSFNIRLNRITNENKKYLILTSDKDSTTSNLVVEYINTDKYLYVEYFDTQFFSYLEKGMILTTDNFIIQNRDFEKFKYTIGKKEKRGVYLMNYLYQKDGKNKNSKYNFYIPNDTYFSYTDYLENADFIDNQGNFANGITPNPNYENDNTSFSDYLNTLNNHLEELKDTSNFVNHSWDKIYFSLPKIMKGTLVFGTHIICILLVLKLVGWGSE